MSYVSAYPVFLINPCILPLKEIETSKIIGFGKYNKVTLKSPNHLPHAHYSRLIIANLTTHIHERPERSYYLIASSISDFFKKVTGQNVISGGTYKNFIRALDEVFDTTFKIEPNGQCVISQSGSLIFDDFNIGDYHVKDREVIYTPSINFKELAACVNSVVPIDISFLQFVRSKDVVLAHDLYIYLVLLGLKKDELFFIPWKDLHKYIFIHLRELNLSRFKRRFFRALDLIVTYHQTANISVNCSELGVHIIYIDIQTN